MRTTRQILQLATWVGLIALLGACASPARIEQMQVPAGRIPLGATSSPAIRAEVAIREVTGGKETNPMWISNVASSDFERALEASLRSAGLLAINRQGSKYQLIAHMQKLDQPIMGASMTVTATVQYTLIERAGGKEVFARTLSTPYTAAWNASFLGAERLKLANEGAVRENIGKLIEALNQASIGRP